MVMDTYALEKLTGWTPELSPPPDSPLYRARALAGEVHMLLQLAANRTSFRDGPKDQTSDAPIGASGNLEIPGSRFARPGMTAQPG